MMLHQLDLESELDENCIAGLVDAVRHDPAQRMRLLELLPEQHPLYRNRSTNQTVRMRGYMLAAFEQAGLPAAALPYVLQELENSREAYLVAGAARALRGLERPVASVVPFLFRAIDNVRDHDDAVTFDTYKPRWPLKGYTTALGEIAETFGWLGSAAYTALDDLEALAAREHEYSATQRARFRRAVERIRAAGRGAGGRYTIELQPGAARAQPGRDGAVAPVALRLEDQHGRTLRFDEFFRAPSIVVFFYTRCTNPNKCSLSITRLAGLQREIERQGLSGRLQTAAITYDPLYDLPPRLHAYGLNRGVRFGPHDSFFRAMERHDELGRFFALGVNYNGAIVNHHRIELFVLDRHAAIAATFARLQWDIDAVLERAKSLV